MGKTLYVSDLDGTLLNGSQRLSEYSHRTVNRLVGEGMIFSYATARSGKTAVVVTAEIDGDFPTVIYNGCFVVKRISGEILYENYFSDEDYTEIYHLMMRYGVSPIVYSFIDGEEKFSYLPNQICVKTKSFIDTRKGDGRENPTSCLDLEHIDKPFYFSCITYAENLLPVYNDLKERFSCLFHSDIYSGDAWLEIMPQGVNKSRGVMRLKEILGCDRVVAFGDAVNDLPMFKSADECYAVTNADKRLKEIATAVIAANSEDGVAKWLNDNV